MSADSCIFRTLREDRRVLVSGFRGTRGPGVRFPKAPFEGGLP
ncbi:MAG TPA: hypothetical protein VD833_22805 [Vicinamibacterales bacterium]|nr:hypothetical protein [Vicinamibacterales bacterium]